MSMIDTPHSLSFQFSSNSLYQWFSTGWGCGDFVPRRHVAMSGDIFDHHNSGDAIGS